MIKNYLEIGKIVGTHGIRGECRVELWCDSGEFFSYFKTLYLDDKGEKKISVKSRPHKNIALMKIKGVENIDDGTVYGKVSDVLRTGANDVYEVKGESNKPFYMPKIDEIVKEVNVSDEYILIEPMKGLFDED